MTKSAHDDQASPADDAPAAMKPFADDDTAVSVGNLSVENGTARVSISGSLDITRDKVGLKQARALHDVLTSIVKTLEADADLPEHAEAEETAPTKRVRNPFA